MKIKHNYLPEQYKNTGKILINHNYLEQQFSDYKEIFKEIEKVVKNGDFTLGEKVNQFEKDFAEITKTKYAIGVGSGTDALFLSLKAINIGHGDEVITSPYTFYATIGAIAASGARPVFVDIGEDYNIDTGLVEGAITEKTKAIIPIHWSGLVCNMDKLMPIAEKHNIHVIEDAAHAIKATLNNKPAGSFGTAGCFSFHPLKNLNIWGDGGIITTNSKEMHDKLVLLRNHGLASRDVCIAWGYNSRLDSIQAAVASHLLSKIGHITKSRIKNAAYFDKGLSKIPQIALPRRNPNAKQVFHIYVIKAEKRNELQRFLIDNGIDAKIHYPLPMHLQPAAKNLGYKEGDFPVAEETCKSVVSLPVHEFITAGQQDYVISKIMEFYR